MNSDVTLRKQVEAQREILEILIRIVAAQAKQIDALLAASDEMLRAYEATGNITENIDSEIIAQLASIAKRVSTLERATREE
ncbi:hypothetical protein [Edaphobacter sp.]|uniref:hypothetical protein n=1 Tax=Edaphobacter sp. TaxID=1934404 RepID=UPI002DBB795C|nr:hypothetical protein [Edaphobacter sp.]HEU5340075.1 hypothetical protein [Edaphobacter sp.]